MTLQTRRLERVDPTPKLRRPSAARSWIALTALTALTALLAGCGSGGGDSSSSSNASSSQLSDAEMRAIILRLMQKDYFWKEELRTVENPDTLSPSAYLSALRAPRDRYSGLSTSQNYNSHFVSGTTVGFGITVSYEPDRILLLNVQPYSQAAAAGLQRGDAILAVDHETITAVQARNGIDTVFGDVVEGVTKTFTVQSTAASGETTSRDLTLTKTLYTLSTIPNAQALSSPTGPVAYLVLTGFEAVTLNDVEKVWPSLMASAPVGFILDLRENTGGQLSVMTAFAARLLASEQQGRLFTKLTTRTETGYSTSSFNSASGVGPSVATATPIAVLTSATTCSAAEALIAGLRDYRPILIIGANTCGKPYGFYPQTYGQWVINYANFTVASSSGVTGYFDGITPDCRVDTTSVVPWGASSDPLLSAARTWLTTGTCQGTTVAAKNRPHVVGGSGQGLDYLVTH